MPRHSSAQACRRACRRVPSFPRHARDRDQVSGAPSTGSGQAGSPSASSVHPELVEGQSLLHHPSASSGQGSRLRSGQAGSPSASSVHPELVEGQSLLHQVSGANRECKLRTPKRIKVSIPSSSGQWCQRLPLEWQRRRRNGFNPFFIRSVVPTIKFWVSFMDRFAQRFNPFFIRSVVPTDWRQRVSA